MFKIKDLMIKIVPSDVEADKGQLECLCSGWFSCNECSGPCSNKTCGGTCQCTICSNGHTCVCTGAGGAECSYRSWYSDRCPKDLEGLAALKAELARNLAAVEEAEKKLEESMTPQTLEQAEMIEKKLSEAIDEVRKSKAKLSKKPKK